MASDADQSGEERLSQTLDHVVLRIFSSVESADGAAANLKAHGIRCWLEADDAAGMYPSLQLAEGVKLLVAKGQLAEAGQILESKNLISPDELERLATKAIPEPISPRIKLSLPQLGSGVIVGVLLCLLYQWTARLGTKTYDYDVNRDGKPDERIVVRDGWTMEMSYDFNFDGTLDNWNYYDSSRRRTLSKQDDNYDGRADATWYYTNDTLARSEWDTDFNGVPDVTTFYEHALPIRSDWKPNGTNIVLLRQTFQHGVLIEEMRDLNADGKFDISTQFDPFANPIRTNAISLDATKKY